jgi:CHAT domain-containing protein
MNTEMPLHAHVELYDRRLELYELMQAPIHTHLVVLSACETGRSVGAVEATPTSADHVSFPRAFLAAGAQTVIATHWAVEDTTTARIMQSIYDHLLGSHPAEGSVQPVRSLATAHLPIAEALAKAQREQIQYARKEGRSAHPIYWAGVALFGDGR